MTHALPDIPDCPAFSIPAVAKSLGVYRSNVRYWIAEGKLLACEDCAGKQFVLREELIRFVAEYFSLASERHGVTAK